MALPAIPSRLRDKPHYVFHPLRLLRRASYGIGSGGSTGGEAAIAHLPWGLELEVRSREAIGYSILTAGVFDPCVTETLHRLIDPGDLVVDVGANVGYLTSLAASRAGGGGSVIAYEPHPRVFELLQANVARWRGRSDLAPVEIRQAAVSDRRGTAKLASGPLFHENMGLASLQPADTADAAVDLLSVAVERLDDALAGRRIGVMKVDVEGHEPEVLRGAEQLLRAGLIRDLVFEDHEQYPDPSTELVQAANYQLFSLENDLFGLRLGAPEQRGKVSAWPGPSYLATRDPDRALARLSPRGWRVRGIGPTPPWRAWQRRLG
jgi:FkbM family methyltransferase